MEFTQKIWEVGILGPGNQCVPRLEGPELSISRLWEGNGLGPNLEGLTFPFFLPHLYRNTRMSSIQTWPWLRSINMLRGIAHR